MREIILKRILSEPLMHNILRLFVVFSEREERGGGGEEEREEKRRRRKNSLKFRDFIQSERELMKDFA